MFGIGIRELIVGVNHNYPFKKPLWLMKLGNSYMVIYLNISISRILGSNDLNKKTNQGK
jgi:hypothetical protein